MNPYTQLRNRLETIDAFRQAVTRTELGCPDFHIVQFHLRAIQAG
jgi:hypothetical protein